MRWGTIARFAVIGGIILLVALYVRGMDWAAIADSTRDANIGLLVLAVVINIPLIWFKALRLRLLINNRVGAGRLMGFFVASYAADNLVMSQAGLGLRVALLKREGISIATAVAVQGLEKLLEGAGLAIVALPLLGADNLAPDLATAIRWCLIVGGAAAVLLVVLVALSGREISFLKKLAESLQPLREGSLAAKVGVLTLAAWACEVAMLVVTLAGLHLPADLTTSLVVLVAVNVAALVPGLPANVGSFEMAAVVALGTFGVAKEPALGFALLFHASHTIPVTLVGLVGFQRALKAGKTAPAAKAGPVGN
jgi:uncharacterized membrane protein YbhN (UPF0104 family)